MTHYVLLNTNTFRVFVGKTCKWGTKVHNITIVVNVARYAGDLRTKNHSVFIDMHKINICKNMKKLT